MLFQKKRKSIVGTMVYPKDEFANAMSFLHNNCHIEQDITAKLAVLNYFMRAVKMDIRSEQLTSVSYDWQEAEILEHQIFPTKYFDENGNEQQRHTWQEPCLYVDLAKDMVFVKPGEHSRLISTFPSVLEYKQDTNNTRAIYYTGVDFTFVFNGRHHPKDAIAKKEGFIKARLSDLEPLFPHVYTNGREWFNSHTGESISMLCDFRFGLLFEAAKLRNALMDGKVLEATQYFGPKPRGLLY